MPRHRKVEKWADIVQEMALDLSQPLSYVTAEDIKRITGEEPRLMASMDAQKRLPKVFQDHGVFLLPVSDREYTIVKGGVTTSLRRLKPQGLFELGSRLS